MVNPAKYSPRLSTREVITSGSGHVTPLDPLVLWLAHGQDMTLYDHEIRDVDAWEGQGTAMQVSLQVTETVGTGPYGPSLSLSGGEGLSFAALGAGDGVEDRSMAFVAALDDANEALSALTVHTTAEEGAAMASGVISLGACDSGEWVDGNGGLAGAWDWRDRCQNRGRAEQNITYGYRMGTLPVLEGVWPHAAPMGGGLTIEVRLPKAICVCKVV